MKIICIQVSSQLTVKSDPKTREYYDAIYRKPGFFRSLDYWEIPLWIAKVTFNFPRLTYFYCVKDIEQGIEWLNTEYNSKEDYILFSVLDSNKETIRRLITSYTGKGTIICGGYIPAGYFVYDKVLWFDEISDLGKFFSSTWKEGLNFKLFAGEKTIPRLTLSTGCLNHCKFCPVQKTLVEKTVSEILNEIDSFEPLVYDYIYINDKTFGQCRNHGLIPFLFGYIETMNPRFKGFIIQTTATQLDEIADEILNPEFIAYIELGIETFNDSILKAMKKPHNESYIVRAMFLAGAVKIPIIPNIIVGLPGENGETYQKTLDFLQSFWMIISHLNLYSLAVYDNTELKKELPDHGTNENEVSLSEECHSKAFKKFLEFGLKQLTRERNR